MKTNDTRSMNSNQVLTLCKHKSIPKQCLFIIDVSPKFQAFNQFKKGTTSLRFVFIIVFPFPAIQFAGYVKYGTLCRENKGNTESWLKHNCLWTSWWSDISYILNPRMCFLGSLGGQISLTSLTPGCALLSLVTSLRGNSTNQKDKKRSARLCKCFHSYKIHFCSPFVFYMRQIGRFYIG